MNEFKNELEQLSVSQFQTGQVTPWSQQNPYQAGTPYQAGPYPADPSRLCVGFGGFCVGFCVGFCGGFCGGFCHNCHNCHNCGGFCHNCVGNCHHRCR